MKNKEELEKMSKCIEKKMEDVRKDLAKKLGIDNNKEMRY